MRTLGLEIIIQPRGQAGRRQGDGDASWAIPTAWLFGMSGAWSDGSGATRPADEHPCLSLAWVQDKCPVLMRENQYFLPQGEAPSSHILKFELAEFIM